MVWVRLEGVKATLDGLGLLPETEEARGAGQGRRQGRRSTLAVTWRHGLGRGLSSLRFRCVCRWGWG